MSNTDQNPQNPPPPSNKDSSSAGDLASRLEKRFGITDAGIEAYQAKQAQTREIGQSLKEEVEDTTFIDLEKFSKERSRHIETKYGLKPMSDILDPKTEEEKRKELEDYIRRNSIIPGSAMQTIANRMTKASDAVNKQLKEAEEIENSYPQIYSWFENFPGYRPEINIGEKWANQISEQIKNETEMQRSRKKGSYLYNAWKKGKLGIDKYLVIFGVCGAVLMPLYIYYRNKQYKEFIMAERGIKPGEEIDLENGRFELDDISTHRRFFVDTEERQKSMEKLSRKKEIKRLENELYPNRSY